MTTNLVMKFDNKIGYSNTKSTDSKVSKGKKLWTTHPIENKRGTEWLSAAGDSLPLLSPKTLSIYPHIFQVRLP